MRFSIVTPSFRNSRWLKLCVASVADQEGVELEHIVQDAGSDDGTLDWLPRDPRVKAFVEKDRGMYDAINRGYRRAQGELLAHINCDEQYLPGALRKVSDFFDQHPDTDVVFADCTVVNEDGSYVCDRQALVPQYFHTCTSGNLSFLTAATFLRRGAFMKHELWFNTEYRNVGDAEWAARLVKSGLRMKVLSEYTSVFTETGHNLNLDGTAEPERERLRGRIPAGWRTLRPLFLAHYRLRRWRAGHYQPRPHDYSIHTLASPDRRRTFHVTNPTFRWVRPRPAASP